MRHDELRDKAEDFLGEVLVLERQGEVRDDKTKTDAIRALLTINYSQNTSSHCKGSHSNIGTTSVWGK